MLRNDPPTHRVILTHEHTDFDALASLLAAAKLYPHAIPVLPNQPNRNLRSFLSVYWDELPFVRHEDLARRRVTEAILVDTQSASPVKGMGDWTVMNIIDHHPLTTELAPGWSYHGEELGATTTILVEEIQQWGLSLSAIEATLLMLGIHEDTGSLTYTTTTPRDVHAAAWLLERGANLRLLTQYLHHPLSEEQLDIYGRLVNEGDVLRVQGYDLFIAALKLDSYVEELSTLAHKVSDILDPDAAFMLFQYGGDVQLIARSVTDAIDVGAIARQVGGGGHAKAAAAIMADTELGAARRQVEALLDRHIRPPLVVQDIMSYGVHTLSPDMTIAQAEQAAKKYGHEGFPVLKGPKLVGVVTRREIERALYHHLAKAPIERIMRRGDIHVTPADPVDRVPEVMTQHDLGQIPVVEQGQVLGIVTRTDLVKLLVSAGSRSRKTEIVAKLEATIPAPRRALILKARDVANRLGYSLYIVGGFVRDLLLGIPDLDIDLVVEGDAIRVARELAHEVGGEVHSHRRFGTAKLILGGTHGTTLPESLDLATARIEFYEPNRPALPRVEGSSIQKDLERRDFTINTLAICLDHHRYGELLDHFGGVRDLEQGIIRVLHYLSFIEDPTRILRAIRLEQRLDFEIEAQTAERILEDVEQLSRVTGQRLRSELELMLREREPEKSWQRMEAFGAIHPIHPALANSDWLQRKLPELRQWWERWAEAERNGERTMIDALSEQAVAADNHKRTGIPLTLSWCIVGYQASADDLGTLADRLKLSKTTQRAMAACHRLRDEIEALADPALRPDRIDRLLQPYDEAALLATYCAQDDPVVRQHIQLYLARLRWITTQVDGHYLRALGLKPGPIYGRILDQVRRALLQGRINTRSQEEALVKELLAKEENG